MQMLGKGVLRLGEPTCVAVPRGLLIFRVPGANPQAESQSLRVVLGVSWYTHRGLVHASTDQGSDPALVLTC